MIPFDLYVHTIEIVCISLAAAGAFIFDAFFILSRRNHKVTNSEHTMLRRINLLSLTAGAGALLFFVAEIASYFTENSAYGQTIDINSLLMKFLLFLIAIMCSVTIRKIHLPALRRHQLSYAHLSESMEMHQRALVGAAVYSTVSWMGIILLSAMETPDGGSALTVFNSYNFITLTVLYILICYVAEYLLFNFKKKYLL